MTVLPGDVVRLRPPTDDDVERLAEIRRHPEVHEHWRGGDDMVAAVREDLAEEGSTPFVIEVDGAVVGWIQYDEELEPDYRSANIDIYLDAEQRGRGLGVDAIRALLRHLIDDRGHHRVVIEPAAHNAPAIRCYSKAGFQPVGITRNAERGNDGTWHDGLLMDLLAEEFTWRPGAAPPG